MGVELARLTDAAEPAAIAQFPAHPKRCKSCAFTAGTFPNGCPETVIEALACVVNGRPFYCHQKFDADGEPTDLCSGWLIAMSAAKDIPAPIKEAVLAAWEDLYPQPPVT